MSTPRILATLAVVVLTVGSAAGAEGRVRLGLEGGLNYGRTTWSRPAILDPQSKFRPAWSAGLALDVPLVSRLSLATGLRYLEYGERLEVIVESPSSTMSFDRHWVWRYLDVPVHLRFRPAGARGFYIGAGPEVSYLLTVWHKAEALGGITIVKRALWPAASPNGQIFEEAGTFDADPNGQFRRWNLALSGGVGFELPRAGRTPFAEVRYAQGLTNVAKTAGVERHTRGFEALVGLLW